MQGRKCTVWQELYHFIMSVAGWRQPWDHTSWSKSHVTTRAAGVHATQGETKNKLQTSTQRQSVIQTIKNKTVRNALACYLRSVKEIGQSQLRFKLRKLNKNRKEKHFIMSCLADTSELTVVSLYILKPLLTDFLQGMGVGVEICGLFLTKHWYDL